MPDPMLTHTPALLARQFPSGHWQVVDADSGAELMRADKTLGHLVPALTLAPDMLALLTEFAATEVFPDTLAERMRDKARALLAKVAP